MKYKETLYLAMQDYCPCCGRGGDTAIKYVQEHDNDPIALYKEAIELGDYMGGDFINIILSSDYNIFTPWYKAVLIYFKEHGETGVTWDAADILDYYKEEFDKVGDLNEVQ